MAISFGVEVVVVLIFVAVVLMLVDDSDLFRLLERRFNVRLLFSLVSSNSGAVIFVAETTAAAGVNTGVEFVELVEDALPVIGIIWEVRFRLLRKLSDFIGKLVTSLK